jgi:hypothetical protein
MDIAGSIYFLVVCDASMTTIAEYLKQKDQKIKDAETTRRLGIEDAKKEILSLLETYQVEDVATTDRIKRLYRYIRGQSMDSDPVRIGKHILKSNLHDGNTFYLDIDGYRSYGWLSDDYE